MPSGPLVILTMEEADNLRLAGLLGQQGVKTVSYPCISTEYISFDPDEPVAGRFIADYSVVVFTSKRGAIGFRGARSLLQAAKPLVACIGETTAQAARQHLGVDCDILPATDQTGSGLANKIIMQAGQPRSLLYVRGTKSTGTLTRVLEENGWTVNELTVYRNDVPEIKPLELDEPALGVFASPSAARRFFKANSSLAGSLPCVAIGPLTGDCLRDLGLPGTYISPRPGFDAVAATIAEIIREDSVHGP